MEAVCLVIGGHQKHVHLFQGSSKNNTQENVLLFGASHFKAPNASEHHQNIF